METQLETKTNSKKIKLEFKDSKYATGRRKKSVARVWLKKGSGNIHVNGKIMVDYFKKQNLQMAITRPFAVAKRQNEFDVRNQYNKNVLNIWITGCRSKWAKTLRSFRKHRKRHILNLVSNFWKSFY